jgi:hypothetical protein
VDGQFGRRGRSQLGRSTAAGGSETLVYRSSRHGRAAIRFARVTLSKQLGNHYAQPDSREENHAGGNG